MVDGGIATTSKYGVTMLTSETDSISETLSASAKALKTVFDLASGKGHCTAGSYAGTGTYGSTNPNSLTFDFVPQLLFILSTAATAGRMSIIIPGRRSFSIKGDDNTDSTAAYAAGQVWRMTTSISDKTVSWYTALGAAAQMNTNGNTYYYVAVG